ncbi:MAG: AAA family ATPase [Myxococcota bacterium]|nr:AAA family ATPase [Myxococcota bacterium]
MSDFSTALQEGRDLIAAARRGELPGVHARSEEIQELSRQLDTGASVLLLGEDGVGKTALIHGLAHHWRDGDASLIELSTSAVMAGTKYLGEWQSKVKALVEQAQAASAVLYIPDIWNLPNVGRTDKNDNNLLDALRPYLQSGRLQLLAEVSPGLLRQMERTPGFVPLFRKQRVHPMAPAAVRACVQRECQEAAVALDDEGLDTLLSLSSRFSNRAQPGPALASLGALIRQVEADPSLPSPLGPPQVERSFSELSGLPMFVVSRSETRSARDIRAFFSERIVGQQEAIEAVIECIALFKAGLQDPDKPIGTFLFVGPTGVGKTELARTLARFLFGSESRLLRFDLSEFKDYHSFEMLVGSARDPSRPAALVDPIRAQPFQVVLFDELEKAHPNVWDLLLGLLDEGRITPPGGRTVDCRNTIVIATSNVGAQDSQRTSVGFDGKSERTARRDIERALEQHFRPEFLNRFQHLAIFHALTPEQVLQVARWELRRVVDREGIAARNLVVEVEDEALQVIVDKGFDPRYGARGLKREIQRRLVLPLAMTLMETQVSPGSILRVQARNDRLQVRVIETREARLQRRRREPPRLPEGGRLDLPELRSRTQALSPRITALSSGVGEDTLLDSQAELEHARAQPGFWNDPEQAARVMRDLDQINLSLDRIERLRLSIEELQADAAQASATALSRMAERLLRLEDRLLLAERQMLRMGPSGTWDALVHIEPQGKEGWRVRDLLVKLYEGWAADRHSLSSRLLLEPRTKRQPALLAVEGTWAHGWLAHESGLHRLRLEKESVMARVRVVPWTDAVAEPEFLRHKALSKETGAYGGTLRSRVELKGGLVLQSGGTLADNRALAAELYGSWLQAPEPLDEVVRRYRLEPMQLKDHATGVDTQRKDALGARFFHTLLEQRVDLL